MLLNLQQETQENTVQQQQQQGYPLNEKEILTSEYNLLQVYLWQKKMKLCILLTYTTEKIQ